MNLYLPEEVRDVLQKIAAKEMLKNPKKAMSAAKVATEIIVKYLEARKEDDNYHSNDTEGGEEKWNKNLGGKRISGH
ncbi:MAG: hypothetical protein QXF25_01725 [Candidatus Pacearchaeota archaeon]